MVFFWDEKHVWYGLFKLDGHMRWLEATILQGDPIQFISQKWRWATYPKQQYIPHKFVAGLIQEIMKPLIVPLWSRKRGWFAMGDRGMIPCGLVQQAGVDKLTIRQVLMTHPRWICFFFGVCLGKWWVFRVTVTNSFLVMWCFVFRGLMKKQMRLDIPAAGHATEIQLAFKSISAY